MELKHTLINNKIHIATIQETKLQTRHKTPKFPDYTTLRLDRQGAAGGGLITLIHKDIPFTHTTAQTLAAMPPDNTLELQSIRIQLRKQALNIFNTYIPPASSCPPGYAPQLDHLNSLPNTFILGDLNAHDPTWLDSQQTDTRGLQIIQQLTDLQILNNTHTHVTRPLPSHPQPSSPLHLESRP